MIFVFFDYLKRNKKTSFPSGRRGRRDPFEWLPCVLFFYYYYYWVVIIIIPQECADCVLFFCFFFSFWWWWGRGICFSCGASATFRNSDDDVEMNNIERIHFLAFLSFFLTEFLMECGVAFFVSMDTSV